MPNWCNNTISITGPKDKITNLFEEAKKENGLLQAMYPMPKELLDTTADGSVMPNWYNWRVENWGTKWDVDIDGLELSEDGTTISGWFDSAWSPPIEAYSTFLIENEDCSVDAYYEEGGMDFAGHWYDGIDDFCDGISDYARKVIKTGDSGSDLYDLLDEYFEITENRREWIEEEMSDTEKFIVEGEPVNG